MSKARIAAEKLLTAYHDVRGTTNPAERARELVGSIFIRDHRWIGTNHTELADRTLRDACFNVDDLAENYLGVTLHILPLNTHDDRAGAAVFGFAQPLAREVWICQRAADYEPLYRATMMHELGHVVLHTGLYPRSLNYSPNAARRLWYEQEADEFMHCALLPEPVLLLGIAWAAQLRGMDVAEAIRGANTTKGRWQWRTRYLPILISRLCVSKHLMALKLKHLGVFSEETLQYHLSHIVRTRWRHESPAPPPPPLRPVLKNLKRRILVPVGSPAS